MQTEHPLIVLFDIDGTLLTVDSNFTRPLLRQILNALEINYPNMETDAFSGRTDFDILNSFLKNHDYDTDLYEKLKSIYRKKFISLLNKKHIHNISDTHNAIQFLHDKGCYLGLLTGNFQDVAAAKLKIGGYDYDFNFGVYGEFHKDRNELPKMALDFVRKQFKTEPMPEKFVIIGDTTRDIECAKNSGMKAVAVATGKIPKDVLAGYHPDLLLDNLAQPEKWFKKLFP